MSLPWWNRSPQPTKPLARRKKRQGPGGRNWPRRRRRGSSLLEEETKARAELNRFRDSVVQLGAPAIEDTNLAAAWQALTAWARAQHAERSKRQPDLDATAAGVQHQVTNEESTLIGLLTEHGITEPADPARAAAAVATQRERATNWSPRTLVDRFPLCRIYIRNVNRSLKTHRAHFPQAALFPDAVVIALDVVEYGGPGLFGIQPQVLVDELFLDGGVK